MVEIGANERKVLLALKAGSLSPEQILAKTNLAKLVEVMSALSWLELKNLVLVKEEIKTFYSLAGEGEEYSKLGLPEGRIVTLLKAGRAELKILFEAIGRNKVKIGIGYLKELGAELSEGKLRIKPEKIELIKKELAKRENFLKELLGQEKEEISLDKDILAHFKARKGVLKKRTQVGREARLTKLGRELIEKISEEREGVTQLTPELIQTGKWKELELRKYDIHTYAPTLSGGKLHPLTKLANQVRTCFLAMGFKEIDYGYIQSCFWNMDALFVPQDHPARDVQDSFYLTGKLKVGKKLAEKVKALHEKAWKYEWSLEEAEKLVLRTQTTVNTIRYLADHSGEEKIKVFSIGRNFRREAIDATHLPEFTQVEGIVSEKGANFAMLLGILKEFYSRLGFERISFRPSYFPFTEPSLEVILSSEGKLLELGGAGIFRPEVTLPFKIKYPVLAWGLGLERLAMLKLGLKDIRKLYMSDLEWLKSARMK